MKNKLVCNGINVGNNNRQENDFYATPSNAVYELLKVHKFNNNILEPMAGNGSITEVLKQCLYNVTTNELYDYGYKTNYNLDIFDKDFPKFDGDIISNPPYKNCHKYVKRCLEIVENDKQVCLLLKITFLESVTRYKEIFVNHPPKYVYVSTQRISCNKEDGTDNKNNNAMCFCWFVWQKGFKGEPVIRWFNYS